MREWHGWRGPSRSEDIRGTMDIAIGTDHQLYMTRDDLTIGVMTSFEGPQTDSKPSSWVDMNLGTTIALLCDGLVRFLLPLSCPFFLYVKPIKDQRSTFRLVSEPPGGSGSSWWDEGDGEDLFCRGRRHSEPYPRHHHPAAADPRWVCHVQDPGHMSVEWKCSCENCLRYLPD